MKDKVSKKVDTDDKLYVKKEQLLPLYKKYGVTKYVMEAALPNDEYNLADVEQIINKFLRKEVSK